MCELPAGWICDVGRKKNGRVKLTGFVKSTMRTTTSTSKNLADKVTIGTTTNYETKKNDSFVDKIQNEDESFLRDKVYEYNNDDNDFVDMSWISSSVIIIIIIIIVSTKRNVYQNDQNISYQIIPFEF
jgi:hypothetical protein